MSKRFKGYSASWLEQYEKGQIKKRMEEQSKKMRDLTVKTKKSKMNNKKTIVDNIVFDSKKESLRYQELLVAQRAGEIQDLQLQVPFPLIVHDKKIAKYICDFRYVRNGVTVVEDVKSEYTKRLPVYRLKKKLFEAIYQPLTITEI